MLNVLRLPVILALTFTMNITIAGTCAPDKLDGSGKLDLTQLPGRVTYIDFWASWCGPCRQSFPFMNGLKKEFDDKAVTVVAISVDKDPKDLAVFLKVYPADFIVARDTDGKCATEMAVKGMPT